MKIVTLMALVAVSSLVQGCLMGLSIGSKHDKSESNRTRIEPQNAVIMTDSERLVWCKPFDVSKGNDYIHLYKEKDGTGLIMIYQYRDTSHDNIVSSEIKHLEYISMLKLGINETEMIAQSEGIPARETLMKVNAVSGVGTLSTRMYGQDILISCKK